MIYPKFYRRSPTQFRRRSSSKREALLRTLIFLTFVVSACTPSEQVTSSTETLSTTTATTTAFDLAEQLDAQTTRAGRVVDGSALFTGVTAEGAIGDYKIYNNRVQFIIQDTKRSGYLLPHGGTLIDGDIIRPEGAVGHDFIEEIIVMSGFGHAPDASTIEVLETGENGPAKIRVSGKEAPLTYVSGALESPDIITDWGLEYVTDYTLEPDSYLLKVVTTVTNSKEELSAQHGDLLSSARSATDTWFPGTGLGSDIQEATEGVFILGKKNESAIGIFPAPDTMFSQNAVFDTLGTLLGSIGASYDNVTIETAGSHTMTRYYGVGPDIATINDSWLALSNTSTETISGTVTSPNGVVAGARVNILLDKQPYVLAITDEDGLFSTQVPKGSAVTMLAEGRGNGIFSDIATGHAGYSPYANAAVQLRALNSISNGAEKDFLTANGHGVATPEDPLVLHDASTLTVHAKDGLPFEVRLISTSSVENVDEELVQVGPGGYHAIGYGRDGSVTMTVEPGEYTLIGQRGARYELGLTDVSLLANNTHDVTLSFEKIPLPSGWMVADPHAHAAPSLDGKITMSDRLIVAAATGVQLHFGTDHDHVVDYSALVEPLGLSNILHSIPATEASSVARGHMNVYPLTENTDEPNGDAWRWYEADFSTTTAAIDLLRAHYPDTIVQSNHPMSGLASAAEWSPGQIDSPHFWSDNIDAIEVLNAGGHGEAVNFYLDLLNRGIITTPTGVSDSHSHLADNPGLSLTYLYVGVDEPALVSPELLKQAFRDRTTVASFGPFVETSIAPGSRISAPTTLKVSTSAPSWIVVDTLTLLKDGEAVEQVSGTTAIFTLDPSEDASYIVVATGETPMEPLSSSLPWAMTSAILFDVNDDGWEPPLEPLQLNY
jgi:predicted metal-dependent phosphoesterase TrpH